MVPDAEFPRRLFGKLVPFCLTALRDAGVTVVPPDSRTIRATRLRSNRAHSAAAYPCAFRKAPGTRRR